MLKDEVLAKTARSANVAQFVSFAPTLEQRHSALRGNALDAPLRSVHQAVEQLMARSRDGSVNVRTFHPERSKGLPFHYGLRSAATTVRTVERAADAGLWTIVNETIDVHDGGVSGVFFGGIVEFAPDDTPRCVDKPGTVTLEVQAGVKLLDIVYGLDLASAPYDDPAQRVEFSVHPGPVGYRSERVICWEIEKQTQPTAVAKETHWPNKFSRKTGDKAFGLLIAHLSGLQVPLSYVVPRTMPSFSFGKPTSSGEKWLRTCPSVQDPGHYSTIRGWADPFELMQSEDPTGEYISSLIIQDGVPAAYAGAAAILSNGSIEVEGVSGYGDEFMLGEVEREALPRNIRSAVEREIHSVSEVLGPVRAEWVYDGKVVWIVQLHHRKTPSRPGVIFPGKRDHWLDFDPEEGLDALRELIEQVDRRTHGIVVIRPVGVTSHVGDILRRAKIPSIVLSEERGVQQALFDQS